MTKLIFTEYSSRLAAFGDPVLDEMYRKSKEKKERYVRPRAQVAEKCPGCGKIAMLHREFYATLCDECHASITELAKDAPW